MVIKSLTGFLLLVASTVQTAELYRWGSAPSMPVPLQEIYPALWKNSLVVAGGLAEGQEGKLLISADVYQLRQNTAEWRSLPTLPEPRHHAMVVSNDEALWAFGGFIESIDGQWSNTDSVLVLDQQTNQWVNRNPLPLKLSETVSAVLNGNIHLATGRTAKTVSDNFNDSVHVDIAKEPPPAGIDTPEDLKRLLHVLRTKK